MLQKVANSVKIITNSFMRKSLYPDYQKIYGKVTTFFIYYVLLGYVSVFHSISPLLWQTSTSSRSSNICQATPPNFEAPPSKNVQICQSLLSGQTSRVSKHSELWVIGETGLIYWLILFIVRNKSIFLWQLSSFEFSNRTHYPMEEKTSVLKCFLIQGLKRNMTACLNSN